MTKRYLVALYIGGLVGYKTIRSDGAVRAFTQEKLSEWLSWLMDDYSFTTLALNKPSDTPCKYEEMQRLFIEDYCRKHSVEIVYYDPKTTMRLAFYKAGGKAIVSRSAKIQKQKVERCYGTKLQSPKSVVAASGYYYCQLDSDFKDMMFNRSVKFCNWIHNYIKNKKYKNGNKQKHKRSNNYHN